MTTYAQRDASGIYWHGGLPYPSVSKIIEEITGPRYYGPDTRYADRGTIAHAAVEAWHNGTLDVTDRYMGDWVEREIKRGRYHKAVSVEFALPHVQSALRWFDTNVYSIDHMEIVAYYNDGVNRCAGRKDIHGARLHRRDGYWLTDLKTGSKTTPERWHLIALAGYHFMRNIADDSPEPRILTPCDAWANVMVTAEDAVLHEWTRDEIVQAFYGCFLPAVTVWWGKRTISEFVAAMPAPRKAAQTAWTRPLAEVTW